MVYEVRLTKILYTIDDEQMLVYIHRAKTHDGE